MTSFPSRQPSKIRPRVDFDAEKFRKLVFSKGVDLEWEQCAECPCHRSVNDFSLSLIETTSQATGEARPDCPLCEGRGYFWHSKQEIRAIVTGSSANSNAFAIYGEYARGMVNITTLPEHLPAYGDRFTVLDSVRVFRETKIRSSNAIESTRYPIQGRTLDLNTGLSTVKVLRLQYANADGTSLITNVLTEGVDFTVTAEGALDFTLGDTAQTAPGEGVRYSVTYFARPRYYVADHPHTHRDSVRKHKAQTESPLALPVQVAASLEFMGG